MKFDLFYINMKHIFTEYNIVIFTKKKRKEKLNTITIIEKTTKEKNRYSEDKK